MNIKKVLFKCKKQKAVEEISELQMREMSDFYNVLLKYKKKRPNFNVTLLMQKLFSKSHFKKFLSNYRKIE